MKKIKLLLNLIKTSTKAQIITGVVVVGVTGTAITGGIVYSDYQANQEAKRIEMEQQTSRLEELRSSYDYKVKQIENVIVDDNLNEIKTKLEQFDKAITDKDLKSAEDLNTQLDVEIETILKANEEAIRKALAELKKTDTSKYTDEMKKEFNSKIDGLEALIEKGNYMTASDKVKEIKKLIEANKEKIVKIEEEKKKEEAAALETETSYEEGSNSNSGTSSNSGSTSNNTSSSSGGSTSNSGTSSNSGSTPTPTPQQPTEQPKPTGAVAPSGYSGGLMINWDLTSQINGSNPNGYRQGINRQYFQRYLNGESTSSLLAEMQSNPYYETVNGKKRDSLALDFKVVKSECNSNNASDLVNTQNGLYVSLLEDPFRNKNYDYIESFVVYNGSTNLVYKVGVATIFVDPVE